MSFTIYYRSTRRLTPARASAIRRAADALIAGRTWLSCEPVCFFQDQKEGRLFGGSKPNFQPQPEDVVAAAGESLPDGTVRDMIDVLCRLSSDFAVDWEFSHDHDPGPIGFIRGGVCEERLRQQLEGIGDLGDILSQMMDDFEHQPDLIRSPAFRSPEIDSDNEADDDGPSVLPFRPNG